MRQDDQQDHDDGALDASERWTTTPCFTAGTWIATARGEVLAEALCVGDSVVTRDNGLQPIRWVGKRKVEWHEMQAEAHLKPVLIREGALGNGVPDRDMMVSPNHRMLVANHLTQLHFDAPEVLVAAKHLTGGAGLREIDSFGTTYIHFLFDRHEVLLGNGAWSESFHPDDRSLGGIGNAQRSEIYELFPELRENAGRKAFGTARPVIGRFGAKFLMR